MSLVMVEISSEAAEFILQEKKFRRPNVVVYRDIQSISCCSSKVFEFIPKVKVQEGKEPNKYFTIVGNSKGIPVWIENALIPRLSNASCMISLKKGLFKGLKLETLTSDAKEEQNFSR